jgi:cold shock CspA family protein
MSGEQVAPHMSANEHCTTTNFNPYIDEQEQSQNDVKKNPDELHMKSIKKEDEQPKSNTTTTTRKKTKNQRLKNKLDISKVILDLNRIYQGSVIRWIDDRGFGFIQCQELDDAEIFVHRTQLQDIEGLVQNEIVNFSLKKNPQKAQLRAVNVFLKHDEDDVSYDNVEDPDQGSSSSMSPAASVKSKSNKPEQHNLKQENIIKVSATTAKVSEPDIVVQLKDHDDAEEVKMFEKSIFLCNVCFLEKSGKNCFKFLQCGHVFCKECMQSYFQVQITECQMANLTCPEDKCTAQAMPTQVEALVSAQHYQLYDKVLLATTLETMSDVVLCPLRHCQCPTMIDRDGNMGQCPKCSFVFCIYCKASFHGVAPCRYFF